MCYNADEAYKPTLPDYPLTRTKTAWWIVCKRACAKMELALSASGVRALPLK